MSIWSIDGNTLGHDVRDQRIASGTVGGQHAVNGSFTGKNHSNIIQPLDPRVAYSGAWNIFLANVSGGAANVVDSLGERTSINTSGATITFSFSGSQISVLGQTASDGGRATIAIDGTTTVGVGNTRTVTASSYYNQTGHVLNTTDTTINCVDTTNFASTGTILIDGEQITYGGTTATTFTGCTRAANGTTATSHPAGATIYGLTSTVEYYAAYSQDRVIVWSSINLSPGPHTITITVSSAKNASSTDTQVRFNGFIIGGILGAQNLNTYIDYISITGIATDASGKATSEFTLNPNSTDRQLLGILGGWSPDAGITFTSLQWNPSNNKLGIFFSGTAVSNLTNANAIITVIYLGPSL